MCVLLGLITGILFVVIALILQFRNLFGIAEAVSLIEDRYYYYGDTEGEAALVSSAIKGMTDNLGDVYSQYYTKEEYAELMDSQSGEYSGIGILIQAPGENGATILRVYDDTPMALAGAKSGDCIVEVNGVSIPGITMEEMLASFSSDPEGTDTIRVRRGDGYLTFTVQKAPVYAPYVSYEMLDAGKGYIRIDAFLGKVSQEVRNALAELSENGMTSLVVDLRDNPGGGLSEVLEVATQFLHKGDLIVSIRSRVEKTKNYYAQSEGNTELPMMILINGNSASAAELFTGALKAHGRAEAVGTRSYGKGIVQSFFEISSTEGYLKITTDAYYTPDDICIHGTGITPDYEVELPEEYRETDAFSVPREFDTQLEKAIELLESI